MIYALGIVKDRTYRHFCKQASLLGQNVISVDLEEVVKLDNPWSISNDESVTSFVTMHDVSTPLVSSVPWFLRPIDLGFISNVSVEKERWGNLLFALKTWLLQHAGILINPFGSCSHNGSKPIHCKILSSYGFNIPPYLASSVGSHLVNFVRSRRCIIKPLSGVRATCREIKSSELKDYQAFHGPLFIQELISGTDLRIHVVGKKMFYVHAKSDQVDYRVDPSAVYDFGFNLSFDMQNKIHDFMSDHNLIIAGWDFKIDKYGKLWCLECNPMPGYDVHDLILGGEITKSIISEIEIRRKL